MNRLFSLVLATTAAALSVVGCSCDDPVQPKPGHTALTLQNTFTSTRWCRLQWNNDSSAVSRYYVLLRNGRDTVFADTVPKNISLKIIQDSLLTPGTTYSYSLYRVYEHQHWDSASITVIALDTTKDDYVWDTFHIGNGGSVLYSVWGISPNSVWMCGGIWNPDSGKNYNVLHWLNGKLTYYFATISGTCNGIYGTSDSSVYFVGDRVVAHWNGTAFNYWVFDGDSLPYIPAGLGKVWATPDDRQIFAVGSGGTVLHRKKDGNWEKMETGVSGYGFTHIVGFSPTDLYVIGGTADPGEGILLHYDGSNWTTAAAGHYPPLSGGLKGSFTGLSGSSGDSLVLVGQEVYHRNAAGWENRTPDNLGTITKMEGVDARQWNNIFVVGDFGEILKWDGEKWNYYKQFLNLSEISALDCAWAIGKEVFIVGADHNGALFLHAR